MIITPDLTNRLQTLIDECSLKGEDIIFEKGLYKTATLFLKNNTHIILKKGAVILGSEKFEEYSTDIDIFTDGVNRKRGQALIYAENACDFSITGDGIINGNGAMQKGAVKPFLIRIVRCKNAKLEGIHIYDSGAWNIHLMDSEDICLKNLVVKSKVCSNNDAIDIDACRNCTIEGCFLDSGDDAICLKTTVDHPCTDIKVKDCIITTDWAGIKVGTESVGDFKNICIENTYIYNCRGCAIKLVPVDGGNLENITIRNITLNECTGPIFISNGSRLREYHGHKRTVPGSISNVLIDNIHGTCVDGPDDRIFNGEAWGNAKSCICVSAIDSAPAKNITISNIDVEMAGGVEKYETTDIPQMDDKYPEFHKFGVLPAWGIYARNIDGFKAENICMKLRNADAREETVYENVHA